MLRGYSKTFSKQAIASFVFPRRVRLIPLPMLAGWAGWLIDYSRPVYLIGDGPQLAEAIRVLRKIGVDEIRGYFEVQGIQASDLATQHYHAMDPDQVAAKIADGDVQLVDVRSDAEWFEGHIPHAAHLFLGRLAENLDKVSRETPVVTQCKSGARSAIAASVFQSAGFDVINLTGGYTAWVKAGHATVKTKNSSKEVAAIQG